MFGDPGPNGISWGKVCLADCLNNTDSRKSFVCGHSVRFDDWPAVLKLSAVTYGVYHPEEDKAMLDELQFFKSAEVHTGDLLFIRKNTPELVGMCAYCTTCPQN